jgi:hypothetical protein
MISLEINPKEINPKEINPTEIFLHKFCNVKENNIFIDYQIFKYFANESNYDKITYVILSFFKNILKTYDTFIIHLSLKQLTIKELDKHYKYISNSCEIFKNEFPDKLHVCFIYNAPFIFTQIISILSSFIDKKTQNKIKLLDKSANFYII